MTIGKRILAHLNTLQGQRSAPDTALADMSLQDLGSTSWKVYGGVPKRRMFSKKPFPAWMTENVRPAYMRKRSETEKRTVFLHPLRDMAMRIEKIDCETSSGDAYRVDWVPRKSKAEMGKTYAVQDSTKSPISARIAPSHKPAALTVPSASTSVQTELGPKAVTELRVAETDSDADEDEEATLMEMARMGLETLSQGHSPTIPSSSPPQGPPQESTPDSALEKEEGEISPSLASEPAGVVESPLAEVSDPEVQQPPPAYNPLLFQPLAQPQSSQLPASMIAGGAAFGQASIPRPNFDVSPVAPQLGSLGQTTGGTFQQGGFAGFTGGFSAFVKQTPPEGSSGQSSMGGFGQQSSFPVQRSTGGFGQQSGFSSGFASAPGSGFGTGSTTSSLFGMKPAQGNSDLWDMRR